MEPCRTQQKALVSQGMDETPGLNSRESSHGHSWEGVRGCGQALLVGHQQPRIVPTGSLSSPVTRVGPL